MYSSIYDACQVESKDHTTKLVQREKEKRKKKKTKPKQYTSG